jgi:hypothetical protein
VWKNRSSFKKTVSKLLKTFDMCPMPLQPSMTSLPLDEGWTDLLLFYNFFSFIQLFYLSIQTEFHSQLPNLKNMNSLSILTSTLFLFLTAHNIQHIQKFFLRTHHLHSKNSLIFWVCYFIFFSVNCLVDFVFLIK